MFSRVFYTIIIYTFIIVIINTIKPKLLYNNNKLKEFGFTKNQSIVPIYILNSFIVIVIYITILSIDRFLFKINENNKQIIDLTNALNLQKQTV